MRVTLISNYLPDKQESMIRLAELLKSTLTDAGQRVEIIRPVERAGKLSRLMPKLAKWLGYIDKFIIFPHELDRHIRRSRQSQDGKFIYHICDHSNAMYSLRMQNVPHLVTCNDVLAIRSALGEIPENPTRFTGRILQRWILKGLENAPKVVCISENSATELRRLLKSNSDKVSAQLLPLNYPYSPMDRATSRTALERLLPRLFRHGGEPQSYILHVGAATWYKNRRGAFEIYRAVCNLMASGPGVPPAMVFAGAPLDSDVAPDVALHPDLEVLSTSNITNEEMRALYSCAELLIFPSLQEGFGWPIAEAMACGTRVVTTNRAPMTEVGGSAAFYIDPAHVAEAAKCVTALLTTATPDKDLQIAAGFAQVKAFEPSVFAESYISSYAKVLDELKFK